MSEEYDYYQSIYEQWRQEDQRRQAEEGEQIYQDRKERREEQDRKEQDRKEWYRSLGLSSDGREKREDLNDVGPQRKSLGDYLGLAIFLLLIYFAYIRR